MLLNTFAPPFRLVGGYFLGGIFCLILSIFAYFLADFSAIFALKTAGFIHIFAAGFVISIIIGSLYQLTSVILQKPFFSIKGAFFNLFVFLAGALILSFAMIFENFNLMLFGGAVLFFALSFFGVNFMFSFFKAQTQNLATFAIFVSSLFFIVGITLGALLVLVLNGIFAADFELLLKYHIYFVFGFVFFIIVGVSSVLLPMFSLSHGNKFLLSKIALACYFLLGITLYFSKIFAILLGVLCVVLFIFDAGLTLKKRIRKAYDYWNLNIYLSFIGAILGAIFYLFDDKNLAIFYLFYGFLYPFIVAHLYKIAPFLIWYNYISPFVGKQKVPLLDEMVLKKVAYAEILLNFIALLSYAFFAKFGIFCIFLSVILLSFNMLHFFKFTKFGEKNGRENLQ